MDDLQNRPVELWTSPEAERAWDALDALSEGDSPLPDIEIEALRAQHSAVLREETRRAESLRHEVGLQTDNRLDHAPIVLLRILRPD